MGNPLTLGFAKCSSRQEKGRRIKKREKQRATERTKDAIEIERQPAENVVENEREAKEDGSDMLIQAKLQQGTTNPDEIEDEAQAEKNMIEAGDQRKIERLKDPDGAEENMSESGHRQGQPLTLIPFGLVQGLVAGSQVLPNLTACYPDDCTLLKEQEELQEAIQNLAQLRIMLREG